MRLPNPCGRLHRCCPFHSLYSSRRYCLDQHHRGQLEHCRQLGVRSAGRLTVERFRYASAVLANGKVLMTGGYYNRAGFYLASAELYDPASGNFTPTGSMSTDRAFHTATLMADGRVLVTGGYGRFEIHASAEI